MTISARPKNNYAVLKYECVDAGWSKCSLFDAREDGVYSQLFNKEFIIYTKNCFYENKTYEYVL